MEKIKIQVCLGTACFVMEGSLLESVIESLKNKYQGKIEVSGVRCLEACAKQDALLKAPFVRVDEELISGATVEKIIEAIERRLKND